MEYLAEGTVRCFPLCLNTKIVKMAHLPKIEKKLEIISTLLRRIGIPPPTAPPGESLCIKTGNQIGGWVFEFEVSVTLDPRARPV